MPYRLSCAWHELRQMAGSMRNDAAGCRYLLFNSKKFLLLCTHNNSLPTTRVTHGSISASGPRLLCMSLREAGWQPVFRASTLLSTHPVLSATLDGTISSCHTTSKYLYMRDVLAVHTQAAVEPVLIDHAHTPDSKGPPCPCSRQ